MGDEPVIRTEMCISPASLPCSNCTRQITMGCPYMRVRFDRPDDCGELHEVKRLTLCVFCRDAYKED